MKTGAPNWTSHRIIRSPTSSLSKITGLPESSYKAEEVIIYSQIILQGLIFIRWIQKQIFLLAGHKVHLLPPAEQKSPFFEPQAEKKSCATRE